MVRFALAVALCVFAAPAAVAQVDVGDEIPAGSITDGAIVAEAEDFHDAAHVGDDRHGEEHPDGLPVEPKADLALWSGIVFLLFLGALTLLAWKPATKGLDAREDRIRGDLAAAEKHRLESERLMKSHSAEMAKAQDQVKEILAEARRDAEVAKSNILAEAQSAARAERHRATTEIERAKNQALAELADTYSDRVTAATETVLRRGLTGDDQKRLIDEAVADFRGSRV